MSKADLVQLAYLIASVLFILGLKGLTRPRTAVRGNRLGALGMLVAIVAVLLSSDVHIGLILAGLVVGGGIGAVMSARVQMTDMPQLVALFNGFGGGASALVPAVLIASKGTMGGDAAQSIAGGLSVFIGAVTLTGSSIAFAKLQGLKWGDLRFPAQMTLNAVLSLAAVGLLLSLAVSPEATFGFWVLFGISLVLGVTFVSPIGGADMPVVIALLNSLSGLAAAATGFVLEPQNNALIISGSLVGASGLILTGIMCKAMNRSLFDVLFKQFGGNADGVKADDVYAGKIKSTSAEELAMLLESASRVVFVPGYGMAVSQAQHAVRELTNALEKRGAEVLFGIHPVAGRMPGHMNVLLAEADIDYAKLMDLDAINPLFKQTDVAIVIGANDVVNPLARDDSSSPIFGMPILDVDQARTVVIVKRSLSPGFAGIPNPLFALDNALMFFEDAKKSMADTAAALKEL
ncbi:MAG: NAD(P)(+) transhydrogenase (Re/Si-specific) subunit beta [Planctomycetota bacterium]